MTLPPTTEIRCDALMARWLKNLIPRSRRRAEIVELVHDLTDGYGQYLYDIQRGCCAISGLPFSLSQFSNVLVKHPFAPSLDRITSRAGYTIDNVRLVCIAVNFGMGEWGSELYLTFARAAVLKNDRQVAAEQVLAEVSKSEDAQDGQITPQFLLQGERIAAAEAIAETLLGTALIRQRRRIAGLKRSLTLGVEGLKLAGDRAAKSRAANGLRPDRAA